MKTLLLTVVFLCALSQSELVASEVQNLKVSNLDTCFSPKENCDEKLIEVINSAKKTLEVAIFSITHPKIAAAIIEAKTRGVAVRMVVDKGQAEGKHSETDSLLAANIPMKIGNASGIMHDKYSVVDGAVLETGSFNYTTSATEYNTENQIYITDKKVIQKYQENFERLWDEGKDKTKASLDD